MRRWLYILAAAFSLVGVVAPCSAGSQQGAVTRIHVRAGDGLVYFFLSGTASNRPACAAGHAYWIIKDPESTAGKQQLAILLSARATGAKVAVSGANTCTRWYDGEDVNDLALVGG